MHKRFRSGDVSAALILAITFGILFISVAVLSAILFSSKNDLQKNVDSKVAAAVDIAKKEEDQIKSAEFAELEKQPNRQFQGDATYGLVTFSYPKTWSALTNETSSSPVSSIFHPISIPASGNSNNFSYALNVRVTNQGYDKTIDSYKNSVKNGKLTSVPFRAKNVPNVVGTRFEGEIAVNKQGSIVVLPLRDKTIFLWTEGKDYLGDFNNTVLESLTFVP